MPWVAFLWYTFIAVGVWKASGDFSAFLFFEMLAVLILFAMLDMDKSIKNINKILERTTND